MRRLFATPKWNWGWHPIPTRYNLLLLRRPDCFRTGKFEQSGLPAHSPLFSKVA